MVSYLHKWKRLELPRMNVSFSVVCSTTWVVRKSYVDPTATRSALARIFSSKYKVGSDDHADLVITSRPCKCKWHILFIRWYAIENSMPPKAPVTHVLQPVGDCLATKKQLQPMQQLCDQKLYFSVADQSATGRRQLSPHRPPVGDRSATGGRLITNWLEMGCDWSATGWRLVGDWLLIKQFAVLV